VVNLGSGTHLLRKTNKVIGVNPDCIRDGCKESWLEHGLYLSVGQETTGPVIGGRRGQNIYTRIASPDRMASRQTISSGWFHRLQLKPSCRAGIWQRGNAEQYIKKGENAIRWTWLSCYKFRDNAVRLFRIQESQKNQVIERLRSKICSLDDETRVRFPQT